jgi:hypothetical protein
MSTEEKLKLCIDFIKKIEKGDIGEALIVNASNINLESNFRCGDCGSNDIYGEAIINIPDILRDKAWHLLCDIDGL